MRFFASGLRRCGLSALILAMMSCPASARDSRGMSPGLPRVHVLLIIDRQAGVTAPTLPSRRSAGSPTR